MSSGGKQLSNSFSTGGGGIHFENRIQASFVVLMLTGGFSPCLPVWPISKIKLQGKYLGFDIDDLIVYVNQPGSNRQAKLLCQIKHSITMTNSNNEFKEVIQAAWSNFNNKNVFIEGMDSIALITGPLSATDTNHVRALLMQAKHAENTDDFINKVELANFSNSKQREKLDVFRTHLKAANNNVDLTDEQLWRFLKSFHLLIYDLDIKGVTLSLLHSLIKQYSLDRVEELLALIEQEVTYISENAGFITIDSISDNIRSAFQKPITKTIPSELVSQPMSNIEHDWSQREYATTLALANLIGSWNEKYDGDKEIVALLTGEDYNEWISKIREIIQLPESPITLKNGIWSVLKRDQLWQELGSRIFDDNLELFKKYAITVLSECDPKFDLPPGQRFAASIFKKVPRYSHSLKHGIATSLALIGCKPEALTNCSLNMPESIAVLTIREIFANADWRLWGSLNDFMPSLAEAAPNEFLKCVEIALQQSPCPFDELFKQEGSGITGSNYLTGLLWALESLAWDEQFLTSVTVILGDLASRDPGGNWENRPINSLTTIFLPWFPQTMASITKRKIAVQTLSREVSEVGWKLLLNLLPNQRQMSTGSHKPKWRITIPDDDTNRVTGKDYWEQVTIYTDMAIDMAKDDVGKLTEFVQHLDHLPQSSFEKVFEHLSSENILGKPEVERVDLWTELTKIALKHKRFGDAKWALNSNLVTKIEAIAKAMAPKNPLNLHRILFSKYHSELFEIRGSWQEQRQQLEERRKKAINDILDYGGIDSVLEFTTTVESPSSVGYSLGCIEETSIESAILPLFLDTDDKNLVQFASSFVWGRFCIQGWLWVDRVCMTGWTKAQIGQFFAWLPFTDETWRRVILNDCEAEYWTRVYVNPYQIDSGLGEVIVKLIEYGRPFAAIDCLNKILHDKQPLDRSLTVKALLSANSSNESVALMQRYQIIELIKALQDDPEMNFDDLFQVEWAYLPLLNREEGISPKLLENQLSTDASFFCEVIRLVYRSKKESESNKELTQQRKTMAENAYRLLDNWQTPPGIRADGSLSGEDFRNWLERVKSACIESGHLEVALTHVGKVLFYCPPDPSGLWIDRTVAEALNAKDAEKMRSGFRIELYNSRGVHWIDPTGKPERDLASKYRNQAEALENVGFHRFATTLREIADSYEREAEQIIAEHELEEES